MYSYPKIPQRIFLRQGFNKGVACSDMILVLSVTKISLLVSIVSIYGEANTQIHTQLRVPAWAVMQKAVIPNESL